jgi:hypothetical protein
MLPPTYRKQVNWMNERNRKLKTLTHRMGWAAIVIVLVLWFDTLLAADSQVASIDTEVQNLKSAVLDLNRDLFMLEEELLYPANTQVAVFVSMDVGEFFALDSVQLKFDGKPVSSYLYSEREVEALHRGGVQRLYLGNVKTGDHEIVAIFTGRGPHGRDYRRGATLNFEKQIGAKFVELQISDREIKQQPEFLVREWE